MFVDATISGHTLVPNSLYKKENGIFTVLRRWLHWAFVRVAHTRVDDTPPVDIRRVCAPRWQ